MEAFANQGLTFTAGAIIVKYQRWELWKFFEMVTNGNFTILTRYRYRKTESEKRVPSGVIFKVQTPEITVWAFFFLLCESGQIRHFWAQIFLFRDVLRWRKTLRMFQLPEPFFTSVFPWFSLKFSIDLPFWKPVASLDKMLSNRSNKWIIRCP